MTVEIRHGAQIVASPIQVSPTKKLDGGNASVREARAHVIVGIKGIELHLTIEEARAFVRLINGIILRVEQRAKLDARAKAQASVPQEKAK